MAGAEWVDPQADRVLDRQRGQVDSAKVVAVFAAGTAGAIVASALQTGTPNDLDRNSVIALAGAAILTLIVVFLDRVREADHEWLSTQASVFVWTPDQFVIALQAHTLSAITDNEKVVSLVRHALLVQILVASAAGLFATLSLLHIEG